MTTFASAAGHMPRGAGAGTGFDLNSIGTSFLQVANHRTFGVCASLMLLAMLVFRLVRRKPIRLSHGLKLIEGFLGFYLGLVVWTIFTLTDPPATDAIGHEMLPYVGLVTLLVMCSFAIPALKHAFVHDTTIPTIKEAPPVGDGSTAALPSEATQKT